MFYVNNPSGSINLQQTLSSSTNGSDLNGAIHGPHHPINCITELLTYEDDGTIRCEHGYATMEECPRNQAILDASIALLLIEIACKTL